MAKKVSKPMRKGSAAAKAWGARMKAAREAKAERRRARAASAKGGQTKVKVRSQRKSYALNRGIKRKNMKKHANTRSKGSLRQKRKQAAKTR